MIFVAITVVLLVVCLSFLGFKVMKKYSLTYDQCQVNIQERCVVVNDKQIHFEDIDYITVIELEQPSWLEKSFSILAWRYYMARVVFYLKRGPAVSCTLNCKEILYPVLTQLKPYVSIKTDIDKYKPSIFRWVLAGICLVMMLMCILSIFKH